MVLEPDTHDDVSNIDSSSSTIDALTLLGEHLINSILAGEPLPTIMNIIDTGAPLWYQNEMEGVTCLHAAAYVQNTQLVEILIEKGAIWNAVDYWKHTAGDIALSYNDVEIYQIIRSAGIRSELLLARLSSKFPLASTNTITILQQEDTTGIGSLEIFLSSPLRFTVDEHGQTVCMLQIGDDEEVGVMMGWENGIMAETVERLYGSYNGKGIRKKSRMLNIGFGLGIIDGLLQSKAEEEIEHVIVEAHPDVLKYMRGLGWYEKKNVTVLEGKWQDLIESEKLLGGGGYDIIYTDTFSEDYRALHDFFGHLPKLLSGPQARFSFFNGLGATNALFYDVYTQIAEMHLTELGMDLEWSDVDVSNSISTRWGTSREYFSLPIYRLPIGKLSKLS